MIRYQHNGFRLKYLGIASLFLLVSACQKPQLGSQFRQWMRNHKGKKEVLRKAPPNMVYIPSGKFVMGELDKVTTGEKNTMPHIKEVEAFYLDQTEVSNKAYLAYLYWLQHNAEDPLDYRFALPDTQCWRRPMSYNEPLVRNYLRHNAFQYYPVVGVSWVQASQYCEWRGARINELDSMSEDSVIIRLPSELEWEYAALTNYNYNEINMTNDRYFSIRQKLGFGRGKMMHNFQRGSGDVGGLGHRPNDAGFIPAPVYMYEANDYGLYNIYGNVAEWVGDTYLPVTLEDIMEQENPGESLYNDSLKKDKSFITPDETFARIMDSLGIKDVNETEVETDITGAILRVYKGGSWRDRAYYLTPGSRRFLPQNIGADNIGFRCASDIPDDMRAEPREEAETETPGTDSVEVDKKAAKKAPADSSEVKDKATLKAEKKAEKEAAKAAKAKEKEKRKKEKEKAKAAKKEEESDDSTD